MKYPIVITYIRTPDNGQELRMALRSLSNISNWNSEVFIVGDEESWFTNLTYIKHRRLHGKPYQDVINKIMAVCIDERVPETFILTADDVFITQPLEVTYFYDGQLTGDDKNYYRKSKKRTAEYLKDEGLTIFNYETHTPFIINKQKFRDIYLRVNRTGATPIQWRSVYGNYYQVGGEDFRDAKTKQAKLKDGKIISTQFYTSELDKLFPKPCEYEQDKVR